MELVRDILPKVLGAMPAVEPGGEVESIQQLSLEAKAAHDAFLKAGQAFACITQQLAELQTELMQAALDMHAAKCRADKAVATVKELAGLV